MNVLNIFRRRRSVRLYKYQPIPEEAWADILEAGRIAATSRNKQARRFVTFTNRNCIHDVVRDAKMHEFLQEASALVVGCTTDSNSSGVDVLISLTQMETMAVSHGLGTLWLGTFDRDVVAQKIHLPEGYKIISMMAFGYAASEDSMREKLSTGELYFPNTF